MRHGPQRTLPSSATGVSSSQTRSYSRTAVRPPPRSTRLEPARAARSSSSFEGRCSARRRRFCSAAGCSRRSSGRISPRTRPRFVLGFELSLRGAHDAVLALDLDRPRRAARDEAVEHRLDLVGGGVARRAETVAGERVAQLAKRLLGGAAFRPALDHLRAEHLAAEAGVLLRLLAAEAVVHVQRVDPIAERPQHVPEAGRVGAARDERDDLAAGRDQLVAADVLLDAGA